MTTSTDSILPFALRLNALEAKVIGTPSYPDLDARAAVSAKAGESSKTAIRRMREIEEGLEKVGGEHEGLRRFIRNYDTYLPLLSLPDTTAGTVNGEGTDVSVSSGIGGDYDIIPDKVKVTMLLEAAADIRGLERDLREVEIMKGKDVDGAGDLGDLLPLRPELADRLKTSRVNARDMDDARRKTTDLLLKYNDYTNALSDLFLEVHRRLEEMEEAVSRAERKRRKELAERY